MQKVKLVKAFQTHNVGTILEVSDDILKEIGDAGVAMTDEAVEQERVTINKKIEEINMSTETIVEKKVGEVEAPTVFKSMAEFLLAVKNAAFGQVDARLAQKSTGQNEATPADGGYLVQHDLVKGEIFNFAASASPIVNKCRVIEVADYANGIKVPVEYETARSATSMFGGIRFYSPAEGVAKTAFKQALNQVDISLNKLCAVNYMTDELVADAPGYEAHIAKRVNEGFGAALEREILFASLSVCTATIGHASVVDIPVVGAAPTFAELWKAYNAILPSLIGKAEWYFSNAAYTAMVSIDWATTNVGPRFVAGTADKPYGTLFGLPINKIESMKASGTIGDWLIADFSNYLLIKKAGIKFDSSISVKFLEDEVAYRWVMRVGGSPLAKSTVTLDDGTVVGWAAESNK